MLFDHVWFTGAIDAGAGLLVAGFEVLLVNDLLAELGAAGLEAVELFHVARDGAIEPRGIDGEEFELAGVGAPGAGLSEGLGVEVGGVCIGGEGAVDVDLGEEGVFDGLGALETEEVVGDGVGEGGFKGVGGLEGNRGWRRSGIRRRRGLRG